MTIIRELVLHLAKVILKHSVKLRRYILCGDVAAYHRSACVLCAFTSFVVYKTIPGIFMQISKLENEKNYVFSKNRDPSTDAV
jgi:hypothetical protein